jgi:hypothetical protein
MKQTRFFAVTVIAALTTWVSIATSPVSAVLRNDRYTLNAEPDGAVAVKVAGMPPQRLVGRFIVMMTEPGPTAIRESIHPNYVVAPRTAIRWRGVDEPLDSLNQWLATGDVKAATGLLGTVRSDGAKGRVWEFRDTGGSVKLRVTGPRAMHTSRPMSVGTNVELLPIETIVDGDCIRWRYAPHEAFELRAQLTLPGDVGEPTISFQLTVKREGQYSTMFTGAPAIPFAETLPVPQECEARGHKLFDYVVSDPDLRLPRAHVASKDVNIAVAVAAPETAFRLPSLQSSRCGLMIQHEGDGLRPVLMSPLFCGPGSFMRPGSTESFTLHVVMRPGEWADTYTHIARNVYGFRDQRDNTGPGSLNGTLERTVDFLVDRNGGNHALWDEQQKYYDYFTDKTGVFKPFSPLYGLSVAMVTDDEALFRRRALPAVEYAISRRFSVFAPYEAADNKQANSAVRTVGAPYIGHAQLMSLHELFGERSPVLRDLAECQWPKTPDIADLLSEDKSEAIDAASKLAKKLAGPKQFFSEEEFFDVVDLASITGKPEHIKVAREAAYQQASKLNLYPTPPDTEVTVDAGGKAPVHYHSIGRHRNQWGFPAPQPVSAPEQTVPAWRIARLGLQSPAYPAEYWMNLHGALMRTAGLARDTFLRDIARWGMVGRFGNYPGDNRSQDSLVAESPDAVDQPPWLWNFATVNPGHAWDFAAAVLDFLVSDAFERSAGAIDFPAVSAAGSNFRVRIYGAKAGRFYDDKNVRLWLPRGLLNIDSLQIDWLAGYGNGNLYLALWNQSFAGESAEVAIDKKLARCSDTSTVRVWKNNATSDPVKVADNRFVVTIPAKGIVALAIPATTRPSLQSKLYANIDALGANSFTTIDAPFGPVHASLLRAGRGMTTAYVYTAALPENVIAARLLWRQGDGDWQEQIDAIYPYEFSPALNDAGGFACVLEVEDAEQRMLRSPLIVLGSGTANHESPPERGPIAIDIDARNSTDRSDSSISDEFIGYLQQAANADYFGLRDDGRYYPYSTPEGRRIGWRQRVWDKSLFSDGCTPEEAEQRLRASVAHARIELIKSLARRMPTVDFQQLDVRQKETLLDFVFTEGVDGLRDEFVAAVVAGDWKRVVDECMYVRYAGHAPDHPRNRAFAARWKIL